MYREVVKPNSNVTSLEKHETADEVSEHRARLEYLWAYLNRHSEPITTPSLQIIEQERYSNAMYWGP